MFPTSLSAEPPVHIEAIFTMLWTFAIAIGIVYLLIHYGPRSSPVR